MQSTIAGFALRSVPLLLWMAFPAVAADSVLPDTVVSATLVEHEVRTAPASVSVIRREQIEEKNATDLLEVVRGEVGITLSPRQVGGRKTLALRGLEGKHTLTLIDGRRIAASDDVVGHSDYQYGWLPVSAIERVEIIRGPMSTLYGSEALGGVLNVITRQPRDKWIASVMTSANSKADGNGGAGNRASLYAAGPLSENVQLRFNAERAERDPVAKKEDRRYSEIEGSSATTGGMGATFRFAPGQSLDFQYNAGKEERTYDDVSSAKVAYQNRYDLERSMAGLTWKGDFDGWRGQARAYRTELDIKNSRTNAVAVTRPQNLSERVVDGFAAFRLPGQQITAGGEFRTETLQNDGLKGGKDDATHKAVFVQDEIALGKSTLLTLGVRQDHHEFFGSETSPRAYLVWEASPELVVKGGYGHAFKAPTLKQVSPSYVGAEGPHTFLGNANIKPEKSDSFEIGADWQRGPLNLRATAFRTNVEDLITYRLLSVSGVRRTYLYDNVDKAKLSGIEAGLGWQVLPSLKWDANLNWLRTRDRTTGSELANRPRLTLNSALNWQVADGWSSRLALEHYGRQQDGTGVTLPAYEVWHASVNKQLGKQLSLRTGINNLGNIRLAEKNPNFGYAELGRHAYVTLRADF